MAKLLFVTVGVGKEADIAHGIEELVRRENPDKLVFICSSESKEKIVEGRLLGLDVVKRCAPESHTLGDVNNAKRIYSDCKLIIDRYLVKYKREQNEYVADYTTGTKAMSIGLALAAVAREFRRLSYITGERGEAGRVISGTEDLRSFHPFDVYLDRDLRRAVEFFNCHQFEAAIGIVFALQAGYGNPEFQEKIKFLVEVMRAYQEWDRFDLTGAKALFAGIAREAESDSYLATLGLKKKVNLASQMVSREAEDPFSEIRAVDLYQNALRRMKEGKYDDAAARFYRLVEFLAQRTLKVNHGIDTADVDASKLPEAIHPLLPQPSRGKIQVSLERAYEILNRLNEPLGGLLAANEEMKRLQFKRNNSILAHGFNPILKEECAQFRDRLRPYLKNMMKDFEYLEQNCAFPVLDVASVEKFLSREEAVSSILPAGS